MKKKFILLGLSTLFFVSNSFSIKSKNVIEVLADRNDQLFLNGEVINIGALKDTLKIMILNIDDHWSLPHKTIENIPILGNTEVSKAMVYFSCHRTTSYKLYITVYDKLLAAHRELRDELAMQEFNKPFNQLVGQEQTAIKMAFPVKILEKNHQVKNYDSK